MLEGMAVNWSRRLGVSIWPDHFITLLPYASVYLSVIEGIISTCFEILNEYDYAKLKTHYFCLICVFCYHLFTVVYDSF